MIYIKKIIFPIFVILGLLIAITIPCIAFATTDVQYEISGINTEMLKNANARLLDQPIEIKNYSDEHSIKLFIQKQKKQIQLALQPFGYFNPNIQAAYYQRKKTLIVQYRVKLGYPVTIKKIKFYIIGAGKFNKQLQKATHVFPLKKGDIFNTNRYNEGKTLLYDAANQAGYINSSMKDNVILLDLRNRTADISVHLDTENKFYFGKLIFIANRFNTQFLSRFFSFKPGDTFDPKKILLQQQAMQKKSYFSQVIITPDKDHAENNHIPLLVKIIPSKSQKYLLGLGYGTFTRTRISAGMNLNNLTDKGDHFDARLRASSMISDLTAKYYIPGLSPLTDQWIIGTNIELFTPKNVSSRSSTIFGGYETELYSLKSTMHLNYLVERYKIDKKPAMLGEILYPKITTKYISADELINPHSGYALELIMQGSHQRLFSSTSFVQVETKGKFIFSPFLRSRIILKEDVGYTAVHDIKHLPATLRFFAGELNGFRGYPDESIGPGRYLMISSFEYQYQVTDPWHAAIFYDLGKATDHISDKFKRSFGVGIIYKSPVGPISFYGAHALNAAKKQNSIEFNIGPEF